MEKVKTVHLTGDELGYMITLLNELVDSRILDIDRLSYDEDKALLYKLRSVRNEKSYKIIVTEQ